MAERNAPEIRIDEDADRLQITIRWSRNYIALVSMAPMCIFAAVVLRDWVPFFRDMPDSIQQVVPGTVIAGLIVAVVASFILSALMRGLLGRETIVLDGELLRLQEGALVMGRERRFAREDVRHVRVVEKDPSRVGSRFDRWFVRQARQPSILFEYRDQTIAFGRTLVEEEAQQVIATLLARLPSQAQGLEAPEPNGVEVSSGSLEAHVAVLDEAGELRLTITPRRDWKTIAFLLFWLCWWAFFEVFAFRALFFWNEPDVRARVFLAFWLTLWTVGGLAATQAVLWQISGREIITLAQGRLTVRRQMKVLSRETRYETRLIRNLRADPVSHRGRREAGPLKGDVAFEVEGKTRRFGMSLGKDEAERLVALLRPRLGFSTDMDPGADS